MTSDEYSAEGRFHFCGDISENVTHTVAQMRVGWNAIHRSQSVIDGLIA